LIDLAINGDRGDIAMGRDENRKSEREECDGEHDATLMGLTMDTSWLNPLSESLGD
jgi:hypothetical protein